MIGAISGVIEVVDPAEYADRLPERPLSVFEFRELLDALDAEAGGAVGGPHSVFLFYIIDGDSGELYEFDTETERWVGQRWSP